MGKDAGESVVSSVESVVEHMRCRQFVVPLNKSGYFDEGKTREYIENIVIQLESQIPVFKKMIDTKEPLVLGCEVDSVQNRVTPIALNRKVCVSKSDEKTS